ncbi:MAG TPA: polyprenyl synthetase family protein [Candidatus Paceibacterota bacterium]|nr:polyprenyl synthetase family protein [Candidatus Paceibacterota bacterium]
MVGSVPLSLREFKIVFERALKSFLAERIARYRLLTTDPLVLESVHHAAALITSGGKRLRPYLAYLAYRSYGGRSHSAPVDVQLFLLLELLHGYLLIQDDVVDRGTTRHGILCLQRFIYKKLPYIKIEGDREHSANGQAFIVADLVCAWMYECIARFVPKGNVSALIELFSTILDEVVVGQLLDIGLVGCKTASRAAITKKTELKTARYSAVGPVALGCLLAGKRRGVFTERFGIPFGMAFQVQDDLLDILGNESVTGKCALSDVREGQHTLFTEYILARGTALQKKQFRSYFGKQFPKKDEPTVRALFITSGAIAHGEKKIQAYVRAAERAVAASPFTAQYKKEWYGLIETIRKRKQ